MKKSFIKKASVVALSAALPLSAVADSGGDNWSISGWINEGVTYYDDGVNEDIYQTSENGHTLGTRVTLAGSTELPNSGLTAGFELILEPQTENEILGAGTSLTSTNAFDKESVGYRNTTTGSGHAINVLGNSVHVAGSFGKVTVGLQSMPTDNIAVLEDPSLTLWSAISPVFVGNFAAITGLGAGAISSAGVAGGAVLWHNFLTCGSGIGGIGIDCNGIYRQGVRYDLPAFGPVTVAVGWSNEDVYDIAAKYKGSFSGINTQLALGYAKIGGTGDGNATTGWANSSTDNFQVQAGAMDPGTGIFGSIAYQHEDADGQVAGFNYGDTDAWWLKVGIKKSFNSLGDTSFSFNYGQYNDQFNVRDAGVNGSEVERIGFEVNQYFGSRLIVYGVWEQLGLDVDGTNAAAYNSANDLDTFRTGLTFFF